MSEGGKNAKQIANNSLLMAMVDDDDGAGNDDDEDRDGDDGDGDYGDGDYGDSDDEIDNYPRRRLSLRGFSEHCLQSWM